MSYLQGFEQANRISQDGSKDKDVKRSCVRQNDNISTSRTAEDPFKLIGLLKKKPAASSA